VIGVLGRKIKQSLEIGRQEKGSAQLCGNRDPFAHIRSAGIIWRRRNVEMVIGVVEMEDENRDRVLVIGLFIFAYTLYQNNIVVVVAIGIDKMFDS